MPACSMRSRRGLEALSWYEAAIGDQCAVPDHDHGQEQPGPERHPIRGRVVRPVGREVGLGPLRHAPQEVIGNEGLVGVAGR